MTEWWRKWFTVARSVALGYNVMAIDGDVLVLDDWYWRVKQPPLSSFTMLSQAETGACINGGFSYIQNASSQGPVAWMLFEAMHRAVRWSEDDSALQAMSQRVANEAFLSTCPDDQGLLSDVLWNAMRGEVRFASMRCMLAGDTEALQKLGFKDADAFMGAQVPANSGGAGEFGDLEYAVSGELAEVVCEGFREPFDCRRFGPNVTIRTAVLRMPHSGVPLPPSPEDPATEALARSTPTELFGFLHIEILEGRCTGCWAEAPWFRAGRLGLWHTHLGAPRVQSIGHIHAGLFPGDFQKTIVMQASGHFDWRVAARIGGGPSRVFFANYPDHNSLDHGWQDSVVEVQRVVAYAPGLITSKLDKAEFIHAAEGLAQVAAALGAVAAWPAAPCDAAWVLTPEALAAGGPPPLRGPNSGSRSFIPWYHLRTQFTVLPFGDSLEELQCEWTGFAVAGCLLNQQFYDQGPSYSGRGLLALEFEHLRRRHIHNVTSLREPTPDTTLRLSEGPQPRSANGGVEWAEPQYDQLLRLNTERLLHQPFQRDPIAIFWLDQLVGAVHGMAGVAGRVYDTWRERCRVLRYYDLREDERSDW
ncbi:hypothetical protein PLESTM_000247200 [Pleodorina starrii]|nr:hypothetical protein PLESTM_000247200 [Pleodorina starrii]